MPKISLFLGLVIFVTGYQLQAADLTYNRGQELIKKGYITQDDFNWFETERKAINKMSEEVKKQESQRAELQRLINDDRCGLLEKRSTCIKRFEDIKASNADLEAKIDANRKNIKSREDAYNKEMDAATAAVKGNEQRERDLAARAGAMDSEFASLRTSALEFLYDKNKFDQNMAKTEKAIDDTKLAAYLMQKMAKLMASSSFCENAKLCAQGNKPKEINPLELKDVFTSLTNPPPEPVKYNRSEGAK